MNRRLQAPWRRWPWMEWPENTLPSNSLTAMGKVGNKVLTLLDIDCVFSEMEIETVADAIEN